MKDLIKRIFYLDEFDWIRYMTITRYLIIIIAIIIFLLIPWCSGLYHLIIK